MGMSRRAYAAHRGCSESAVRKAIATGRIATEDDGTIDPATADAEWGARTDPAQQRGAHSRADAARTAAMTAAHAPAAKPVPRAAFEAVKDTLREAGGDTGAVEPGGEVSFVRARMANEVLKAQTARVRLLEDEGRTGRPGAGDHAGVRSGPARARRLAELAGAGRGADGRRTRRRGACHGAGAGEVPARASSANWRRSRLSSAEAFDGAEDIAPRLGARASRPIRRRRSRNGRTGTGYCRRGRPRRPGRTGPTARPTCAASWTRCRRRIPACARRVHEVRAGRRDRGGQQLDRLLHPPRAGAVPGGAADGRSRQAPVAAADRAADRGKPGPARAGHAEPVARQRQHGAGEALSRRAADPDRREHRRRPALDAGALGLPRRGRRLSGRRRRRGRSDRAGRGPDAELRPPEEDVSGVDADDQGPDAGSSGNTS